MLIVAVLVAVLVPRGVDSRPLLLKLLPLRLFASWLSSADSVGMRAATSVAARTPSIALML